MANAPKVLGQAVPGTTLTTLYTVPASTSATCSSVVVCNTTASAATFRISVAVAGAADTTKQYLYYDVPLTANNTFVATVGLTLATTDVVRCYASNVNIAFTLFGIETT